MTEEEAIRIAIGLRTDFKCKSETMVEFCNVVIEALEQEPILDKIRAEIAEIHLIGYATVDGKREIACRAVMQIIDKYKAESEPQESEDKE